MRSCLFCGKKYQKGHKVSHSAVKTIKKSKVNLRTKTIIVDGVKKKAKICAKCLKKLGV